MQETWVQSLGWEDLDKEMATYSSILAWKIPWMEEPRRLHGVAKSQTQLNDFTFTFSLYQWKRDKHYSPVVDSFTRYLDIRIKP